MDQNRKEPTTPLKTVETVSLKANANKKGKKKRGCCK